jgi:hypothetical protein
MGADDVERYRSNLRDELMRNKRAVFTAQVGTPAAAARSPGRAGTPGRSAVKAASMTGSR